MLTVGSLFAGIGGFDLGLERAGMRVIWQSEIDPYASAVLRKHWPDVPNHGDIRGITASTVERPDVLCGGFPCQDISNAGKRAGIDGERSGLWSEYARVIGELRPHYAIMENVSALLGRGLGRVLGDLAALGFDAEWHCIPAAAVGAPHRRDRIWIIAYPSCKGRREKLRVAHGDESQYARRCAKDLHVPGCDGAVCNVADTQASRQDVADADGRGWATRHGNVSPLGYGNSIVAGCLNVRQQWSIEPDVGRVAHGIPSRVDRLRCLGNAIVPQCAEVIGRAIVEAEEACQVKTPERG